MTDHNMAETWQQRMQNPASHIHMDDVYWITRHAFEVGIAVMTMEQDTLNDAKDTFNALNNKLLYRVWDENEEHPKINIIENFVVAITDAYDSQSSYSPYSSLIPLEIEDGIEATYENIEEKKNGCFTIVLKFTNETCSPCMIAMHFWKLTNTGYTYYSLQMHLNPHRGDKQLSNLHFSVYPISNETINQWGTKAPGRLVSTNNINFSIDAVLALLTILCHAIEFNTVIASEYARRLHQVKILALRRVKADDNRMQRINNLLGELNEVE
jgi:hypothetical protein